jgi:hypothetical protein
VTEVNGKVKIDEAVTKTIVELVITNVYPKDNLSSAGGDIITIEGSGFPLSLDKTYSIEISFDSAATCVPFETSSTMIKCETQPFKEAARRMLQPGGSFVMTLTATSTTGGSFNSFMGGMTIGMTVINKAVSMTPPLVSPIHFKALEIQLNADYPTFGMTADDFEVTIVPDALEITHLTINNDGIRKLNVIAVDTINKTLTVKYGGAYSGTYDVLIKSTSNGNVDTAAIQLEVLFEILDFLPLEGSIFGGTKLTIQGGPFTENIKETIVKVGYKWWEDINFDCYMISVTEDEAVCRIAHDLNREAKEYEVIAYASTYEEANCFMDNDCLFTFLEASLLPEVTAPAVAQFDQASGEYQIVITGTGITDTAD